MRLCICECMCMYVCACNCVYMYMCMCVSAWDDALSPFLLEGLICQLRPLPVYIIEREREQHWASNRKRCRFNPFCFLFYLTQSSTRLVSLPVPSLRHAIFLLLGHLSFFHQPGQRSNSLCFWGWERGKREREKTNKTSQVFLVTARGFCTISFRPVLHYPLCLAGGEKNSIPSKREKEMCGSHSHISSSWNLLQRPVWEAIQLHTCYLSFWMSVPFSCGI